MKIVLIMSKIIQKVQNGLFSLLFFEALLKSINIFGNRKILIVISELKQSMVIGLFLVLSVQRVWIRFWIRHLISRMLH